MEGWRVLSPGTAQAGYAIRKLRGKELVERVQGRHRYQPTREGIRVAAFLLKLRDELLEPVIGAKRPDRESPPLEEPDRYYASIASELHQLCDYLGLGAA